MAAPKAQPKIEVLQCNKCGGTMNLIKVAVKNSSTFKIKDIFQCKICRHWIKTK